MPWPATPRIHRLKPDYANAHHSLGIAFFTKGRVEEAIGPYQEALRLKPGYAEARNNLAAALAFKGEPGETSPPAMKP